MHPGLDNPACASLSTVHARFAERSGRVLLLPRRHRQVRRAPVARDGRRLGGHHQAGAAGWIEAIIHGDATALPDELDGGPRVELVQMVGEDPWGPTRRDVISLGPADVPEMLELVRLTTPGPSCSARTIELGDYLGIHHGTERSWQWRANGSTSPAGPRSARYAPRRPIAARGWPRDSCRP